MKKKVLATLLALSLLISLFSGITASATGSLTATLSGSAATIKPGDNVTLTVGQTSSVDLGNGIIGVTVKIDYDETAFDPKTIDQYDVDGTTLLSSIVDCSMNPASAGSGKYVEARVYTENNNKVINILYFENGSTWSGLTASALFDVKFTAKAAAADGSYPFVLSGQNASGDWVCYTDATVEGGPKIYNDYVVSTVNYGSGATASVTIARPVTGVTITGNPSTVKDGESGTLGVTVDPTDATNKDVTWSSTGTLNITSSTTSSCNWSATGAGAGTITATANDGSGKFYTWSVTVESATPVDPITSYGTYVYTASKTIAGDYGDVTFTNVISNIKLDAITGTCTVASFIAGFGEGLNKNATLVFTDYSKNTITDYENSYVTSGTTFTAKLGTTEVTYIIQIYGDVDSDGMVGGSDMTYLDYWGISEPGFDSSAFCLLGADVDNDGMFGGADMTYLDYWGVSIITEITQDLSFLN